MSEDLAFSIWLRDLKQLLHCLENPFLTGPHRGGLDEKEKLELQSVPE